MRRTEARVSRTKWSARPPAARRPLSQTERRREPRPGVFWLIGTRGRKPCKEEALRKFAPRLLTSEVAPHIARLVAFGSTVARTARPESDIDLLIVGTGALSPAFDSSSGQTAPLLEPVSPANQGPGRGERA